METKTIGARIVLFEETESTNSYLLRLPREEADEGLVAVAEHQSAGRGRHGRGWLAPPGRNLLFSALLRTRTVPGSLLTLAAACSAVETLGSRNLDVEVKWPNDIVHEGRKLGGVLCEVTLEPEGSNRMVLGMGLNVNLTEDSLPSDIASRATSVQILAGHSVNRNQLLAEILNCLDKHWQNLVQGKRNPLLEFARERCETLGHAVRVQQGQEVVEGIATDLDENGALVVRLANGALRTLAMGEIVESRRLD